MRSTLGTLCFSKMRSQAQLGAHLPILLSAQKETLWEKTDLALSMTSLSPRTSLIFKLWHSMLTAYRRISQSLRSSLCNHPTPGLSLCLVLEKRLALPVLFFQTGTSALGRL